MGDPRTGEIYKLLEGQEPKEGDVKLTEGEAGYLKMLSDPDDRMKILQAIARKAKEASATTTQHILDISRQLEKHPNATVNAQAWRSLLVHVPQEELERRLKEINSAEVIP